MNFKRYLMLISMCVLVFESCKKEEVLLPEPGFSCKINGVPWTPMQGDYFGANSPWGLTYFPPGSNNEDWANSVVLIGRDDPNAINPAFATNISIKNVFFGLGRYEFSDDSTGWARGTIWNDTLPDQYYDYSASGWIEFHRFDGSWNDKPWCGHATFEYMLYNEEGDTLYITEGEYLDYH